MPNVKREAEESETLPTAREETHARVWICKSQLCSTLLEVNQVRYRLLLDCSKVNGQRGKQVKPLVDFP